MKNILILGAGQSTPYLIKYLLDRAAQNNWFVTVCDKDFITAKNRINGNEHGTAVEFDVNDTQLRHSLIKKSDIVINMLAPVFQYLIAYDCVQFVKHCITASYEDAKIRDLEKDAQRKGILILNEMGLDPGIDHMSAMSMINKVRRHGGYIKSFTSYGGGLPAPDVKANPFNYTITWNPRNVVMSGENGAHYMEDGKMKVISHHEVFNRTWQVEIEGLGTFEAYPNRNSMIYKDIFHLKKVNTLIRGTLRYPGWSETWQQIVKLGMANETMNIHGLDNMTYYDFTEMFIPYHVSGNKLDSRIANFLGISPTGNIMQHLRWLGLFNEEKIAGKPNTAADVIRDLLIKKLPLPKGERDIVIIMHTIEAVYPDENITEEITSTLIEYGGRDGLTAIAKTVGLPAAIAAELLLNNHLPITGTHIPTHPAIYTRVLEELKKLGIVFEEKKTVRDNKN